MQREEDRAYPPISGGEQGLEIISFRRVRKDLNVSLPPEGLGYLLDFLLNGLDVFQWIPLKGSPRFGDELIDTDGDPAEAFLPRARRR